MWMKDKKTLIMNEGDYGLSLPITITGVKIATDEKIGFYVIDPTHMVVLIKEYTNIENNTFDLCLTKKESQKLKAGKYFYKIEWYKEDVFKGTIVENEFFEVRKNYVKGILEEEELVLNLQVKNAIPTKEQQSITYDEEYDALGEVIVEPIPEEYIKPEGTLEITTNGEYDVTENEKVNVNITPSVTISEACYLFYNNFRLDKMNELLSMCENVNNAISMFHNCTSLIELDLSGFDTSNVTDMNNMFSGCTSLTSLDVSNFNTLNVTNMTNMFSGCTSLTSLDVSNFNTLNVTNMTNMFSGCTNLSEINLSGFDTSGLGNNYSMNYMFSNCSNLTKIIINSSNMFNIRSSNVFSNTPIASGTGYVYVPDDLVETYKTASNWSTYADQIKGISELPTE